MKVPDVVRQSAKHYAEYGDVTPMSLAPEICVEVLSPSNSAEEMELKRGLYFAAGAVEVWVCDRNGEMTFFDRAGQVSSSQLAPEFPKSVE